MIDLGTVTQASPLLVRIDGATKATPALVLASVGALAVDNRVAVAYLGRRLLVLGRL